MNNGDKIYIAGHTGLIGSAILDEMKSSGYRNLITKTHQELDLTNQEQVESFFKENLPKFVILAAGKVGGIIQNQETPAEFLTTNLRIQLNVIECAHKYGVKKLILFGSSCMYPKETAQPMSESQILMGKPEITSLPYAMSKLSGVYLCLSYNQQYGETRFIPLIPNSVFGPKDNFDLKSGHVLSSLINKFHLAKICNESEITLWGTGSPRREFIYSKDLAIAVKSILSKDIDGESLPINIGTGHDYSIKDLAEKIASLIGYSGEIFWDTSKPDGSPRKLLDSSRVQKLGWSPEVTLSDGLKSTYKWYLENIAV